VPSSSNVTLLESALYEILDRNVSLYFTVFNVCFLLN